MSLKRINRRSFIKGSMLGASLTYLSPSALSNLATHFDNSSQKVKRPITRRLGKTGIELPVVSMGVMRSDNPALVRAALESGMVHLDTAHGYQKGKNETMLGEVLKDYPRTSFVISTKIGEEDKETFLSKLDTSLQRLRLEYVDILYLHGASSTGDVLSPHILDALKTAKDSGKAKHVGVSTHKNEPEVIQASIDSGLYEVVLTAINFKQDHYQDLTNVIGKAAGAGIGIIGMKTMAGGFHDKEKTRPVNCKAALKWVLQDEHVTTTIPGITTFEQLAENTSVNFDLRMTEEEKADLAAGKSEGGLYCQECGQCTQNCNKGLPIPEIMRAYMYTYGYGDPSMGYALLTSLNMADNPCGDCTFCPVQCAKGFQVAERITDIARLATVPGEFLS